MAGLGKLRESSPDSQGERLPRMTAQAQGCPGLPVSSGCGQQADPFAAARQSPGSCGSWCPSPFLPSMS